MSVRHGKPGAAAPADAMPADRSLTVMTFNIHHGEGTGGEVDLRRIAAVIDAETPAVVGLQEVDRHWSPRSAFVDQTSWLARRLRMYLAFGANLNLDPLEPGRPRRQFGTAIMSGTRILDWENTSLPRFEGHEQRGLLRARIQVGGTSLQVYNTHLQHDSPAERLAQARTIRKLITSTEPLVLLGDLNATPETPEVRVLGGDLADAWVQAGVGDGHTNECKRRPRRIDYVLTSAEVVTHTAAVATRDPGASDHLPVTALVRLPSEAVRAAFRRADHMRALRPEADPF